MKNPIWTRGLRLWVQGLALFALRFVQLRTGFDPDTGLARASAPGLALVILLLLCAASEFYLCTRVTNGKHSYRSFLDTPQGGHLPFLAAGSLLLGAGAVLLPGWGALKIAAAVTGVAAAGGILLFVRSLRSGEETKPFQLLPAMFFSAVFVLVIYLPEDHDPVLERYYLPVLAAGLIACAFYQLTGLTCREGKSRWFVLFGNMAVVTSIAAAADCVGDLGRLLIYLGSAVLLTAFLLTRREALLPEPEEEA